MNLHILRGIPGSGKSRLASELVTTSTSSRDEIVVCSADAHFTRSAGYKFDATQLQAAHDACFKRAHDAMQERRGTVIVDNTNISAHEITPYFMCGRMYQYTCRILWVRCSLDTAMRRQTHGVPLATMQYLHEQVNKPLPHFLESILLEFNSEQMQAPHYSL